MSLSVCVHFDGGIPVGGHTALRPTSNFDAVVTGFFNNDVRRKTAINVANAIGKRTRMVSSKRSGKSKPPRHSCAYNCTVLSMLRQSAILNDQVRICEKDRILVSIMWPQASPSGLKASGMKESRQQRQACGNNERLDFRLSNKSPTDQGAGREGRHKHE